jgi:hypothetical protein
MDELINAESFLQQETKPVETETQTTQTETPVEQPVQIDWLSELEKNTGYKDLSSLKDDLSYKTKYSEAEARIKERDELEGKYKALKESIDPSKIFADEYIAKFNEIRKKFPDVNPTVASRVLSSDLSKMNKIDQIVLLERYKNPNTTVTDEDIKEAVMKEFNIDADDESTWGGAEKFAVDKRVSEAKKVFSEMQNVKVDLDFEAMHKEKTETEQKQVAERKNEWKPLIKDMVSEVKSKGIEIKYKNEKGEEELLHSFKVDDSIDKIDEYLEDFITEKPTPKVIETARRIIEEDYVVRNIAKILKDYGSSIETKLLEKYEKEVHNPKPRNDNQAPTPANEYPDSDRIFNSIFG